MREDYKPGDLSVRLGFGRVYGTGPDRGNIKPHLEITDQCSGKTLTINLTPEDLAEMLGGGAAQVLADAVIGFKGLRDFGKKHEMVQRVVKTQSGDYNFQDGDKQIRKLPHLAPVIAELEAEGYRADTPRRNNSGGWVVIGRRYVEQ